MSKADTIEEFIRSYSLSYVGIKSSTGTIIHPARLRPKAPENPGYVGFTYQVDKTGKELSKDINWQTSRDDLVRGYPKLGMVKAGDSVAYIHVKPLRQWHKGYVPDNVHMHVPNKQDMLAAQPKIWIHPSNKGVIWQIYNREFWCLKEALRLLEEGEGIGYPLSYDFGVYISKDYENPQILYKTKTVGAVQDDKLILFPEYKIYKEQLARDTKCEVSICQ